MKRTVANKLNSVMEELITSRWCCTGVLKSP